ACREATKVACKRPWLDTNAGSTKSVTARTRDSRGSGLSFWSLTVHPVYRELHSLTSKQMTAPYEGQPGDQVGSLRSLRGAYLERKKMNQLRKFTLAVDKLEERMT